MYFTSRRFKKAIAQVSLKDQKVLKNLFSFYQESVSYL